MRWQSLSADRDRERRLPSIAADSVVRTFDAPEALDTRFYEVQAKSALNRVSANSRMPFRWSVNPYRGCTHACSYCASGDTKVLMANGRTKPLAALQPGEMVYGTRFDGKYRRYVATEVLDHWQTIKPAYLVTLEDGTDLVTSGDHRLLTNRGWKYVTDSAPTQRRHLTTNNELLGTGAFAAPPTDSREYRLGYLSGIIHGDGHLRSYAYERPEGRTDHRHGFRLALADFEALRRAREYLADFGAETREFEFQVATANRKPMRAIRTGARKQVFAIRRLVRWPHAPGRDWHKGFLAGIFDAEGSYQLGLLRIHNTDPTIIRRICSSLDRLGFPYAREKPRPNGCVSVRLTLGLEHHLRFFHTVDPAITRKRTIDGQAIKNKARLRVASIRSTGLRLPLYDITTGTGDFIANGVVSHNCFARPTHKYLDLDAGRDFEKEIVVKVNAPERLRAELSRPSWKREHVALGTNTDPYQWVESRYELMPGIWEALRDSGTPCSLVTKSPLVLRDIEVLRQIADRGGISVYLSVPTIDEKAWRDSEPHTPHPRKRLEAVAKLNRAGIPAGVLIVPLMPGINDAPEQVNEIIALATKAKAISAGAMGLHLRSGVREIFFAWLEQHRPDLIPRYEELYSRGAYLPAAERKRLARLARYRRPERWRERMGDRGRSERPPPEPAVSQQTLF